MKATNSDSKRCRVSVDVSLQSPKRHIPSYPKQNEVGRPHRLLLGGVQSKQRRNHFCGGNVLMYAANFQYLIVTTADHGKNAKWCTTVSMRVCHECRITCQGACGFLLLWRFVYGERSKTSNTTTASLFFPPSLVLSLSHKFVKHSLIKQVPLETCHVEICTVSTMY